MSATHAEVSATGVSHYWADGRENDSCSLVHGQLRSALTRSYDAVTAFEIASAAPHDAEP